MVAAMTWKQAWLRCCFGQVVTPELYGRMQSQPWWDDECDDVYRAVVVLVELGRPVVESGVAMCLLALGYSFDEAAALACEAAPARMGKQNLQHYAEQLGGLDG